MQLPMGLAGSDPFFFQKLGWEHLPSIVGIGVAGLSAHYCLTNAFRAGDATLVMPIDFLRVPLIALVGWWFFGEKLDPFVVLGGRHHAVRHRLEPAGRGKKGTQTARPLSAGSPALTPRRGVLLQAPGTGTFTLR